MAQGDVSNEQASVSPAPVGVKEAVRIALGYLQELYSYTGTPLTDLRLEEVDLSDDGTQWLITYGFTVSERVATGSSILSLGTTTQVRREYKVVAVDVRTGEPRSMKIREV